MNQWPKRKKPINKIIVHQSLSEGSFESIAKYHMSKENHITPGEGLPGIAYHYVIKKSGEIISCTEHNFVTWHCKGANEESIGICVLGDFDGVNHKGKSEGANAEQLKNLEVLVTGLFRKEPLTKGHVLPHAAFGKPACPGFVLESFIKQFND